VQEDSTGREEHHDELMVSRSGVNGPVAAAGAGVERVERLEHVWGAPVAHEPSQPAILLVAVDLPVAG
jgi:hypothetical protein